MVQIIRANPKPPSFSSQLGAGIGQALPGAVEGYFQKKQQQQAMAQQNEAMKKAGFGEYIGLPEKAQAAAIAERLKGQEKSRRLESIMSQLQGQSGQKQPSFSSQIQEDNMPEMGQQSGYNPSEIPDDLITGITAIDRDVGKDLRKAKDTALREKSKKEEINAKREESRYALHKDFINDTTKRYSSFESDMKPKLLQMRNIPDEDLVSPTAAKFLEVLDIPLGALENPASELYQKLSLDLLKGLPETYGNRILKVEVDNFLKTIPSLMNSPEGRRMIASNMLKLGEMKEVYYNAMRNQQKNYTKNNEPLPLDFEQDVFDQVKPQVDRINNEFAKMAEIKSVPSGTIPFFNPNGDIEFVPKEHAQWASENGGRRIW